MKKFLLATALFLSSTLFVFAQAPKKKPAAKQQQQTTLPKETAPETKVQRVEIEPKHKSDEYNVAPVGDNGLILFNENRDNTSKGQREWIFTNYSKDFKEGWTKSVMMGKKMEFDKMFYDDKEEELYILMIDPLYAKGEMGRTVKGDFAVVNVKVKTGEVKVVPGRVPFNTSINDFKVMNERAYFGGGEMPTPMQQYKRMCIIYCTGCIALFVGLPYHLNATLVEVDMKSGTTSIAPMPYKGMSKVTSISTNEDLKTTSALITNMPKKKQSFMYIKEYDYSGNLSNTLQVQAQSDNNLLDGSITSFKEGDKLVMGTYAPYGKKVSITTPAAVGVYISHLNKDNSQSYIKYYSFTKFKNFFSYLGTQLQQKVNAKVSKKAAKGKETNIYYNILVHDIIKRGDNYLFIGEAYYKQYHYEYVYTGNGGYYRRVFDGYRYTHAVVAGFDQDGNLLWDNAFPIWDILSMDLKERVKVLPRGEKVILIYSTGGALELKAVEGNTVSPYSVIPIETNYADDKVKANYGGDGQYWYDDYFITWGYQKIKNSDNNEKDNVKNKRFVFYFNKVAFK